MFHIILEQDIYDRRIGKYGKTLRMLKKVDLPIPPFPGLLIQLHDKQGCYEEFEVENIFCDPVNNQVTCSNTYTVDSDDPEDNIQWWIKSLKKDGWVEVSV